MENFPVPDEILTILDRLSERGFEAYLVGGCVRDFLLGKDVKDFDITTNARPEEVKAVFAEERVIETGIEHGTVTVIIDLIPAEVTTYRSDGEYLDHRRPSEVRFTDSVTGDLSRRDFTINAIAFRRDGGIGTVDPFNGREDLRNRIIRAVGEPDKRFTEDALRIMRGMRFASVTGFTIEENTAGSMKKHKDLLNAVSAERIGKEFREMICGEAAEDVLLGFREVVAVIIPELRDSFDFDQRNPYHCYDIYTHSVKTAAALPPDPVLRLAGLLHDVGKPGTFSIDDSGTGHFYGHAKTGGMMASDICTRLKLDSYTIKTVSELVLRHDLMIAPEMKSVRKTVRRFGEEFFLMLLELKRADCIASHCRNKGRLDELDELRRLYDRMLEENLCFSLGDLAINGDDLKYAGFDEGPEIGRMLNACLDAVIADKIPNDRKDLLDYAIIISQKKQL